MNYTEYLNITIGKNTVEAWLAALIIAFCVLVGLRLVKWGLLRYLAKRTHPDKPDVFELVARVTRRTLLPVIIILSLYTGLQVLDLPAGLLPWIFSITTAAVIIQVTLWTISLVDYFLNRTFQGITDKNSARITTLRASGFAIKLMLIVIAVLLKSHVHG